MGAYPGDAYAFWVPPEHWDADDIVLEMSDTPDIWTDGSRKDFSSTGGFEVAGGGVHLPASEAAFDCSVWGTAEEYDDAHLECCRAFLPVPGPLQTFQCAEFWGAITEVLTTSLLPGQLAGCGSWLFGQTSALGVWDTVRVTKVEGHATDEDVEHGRVRLADQAGNAEADAAADSGPSSSV